MGEVRTLRCCWAKVGPYGVLGCYLGFGGLWDKRFQVRTQSEYVYRKLKCFLLLRVETLGRRKRFCKLLVVKGSGIER